MLAIILEMLAMNILRISCINARQGQLYGSFLSRLMTRLKSLGPKIIYIYDSGKLPRADFMEVNASKRYV